MSAISKGYYSNKTGADSQDSSIIRRFEVKPELSLWRIWTTSVVLISTNIPVSPRPPSWIHHRLLPAYSLALDVLKCIAILQPPGPPIERRLELSRRQETAWRWRRLLLRSLDLILNSYICLLDHVHRLADPLLPNLKHNECTSLALFCIFIPQVWFHPL